jgi:hypothetical protein
MLKRIERNTPTFSADIVIKRRHTADCKTRDGRRTSEAIDCPPRDRKLEKQDKCPLFLTGYINGRRIRHRSLRSREIDLAIVEANRRLDELETGIQQAKRADAILATAREEFFLDGIRTKCPGNIDTEKTPEERIQEAISLYDTFRKQNDILKSLMAFTKEECRPPIYYLVDITKEVLERFEDSWKGARNYEVLCRCQCHKRRRGRASQCGEDSTRAECDCCYECSKCHNRIKACIKEHEQRCDGKYEYRPKTLHGK